MATTECECHADCPRCGAVKIVHCPLHAAAGELLEACRKALTCTSLNGDVAALVRAAIRNTKAGSASTLQRRLFDECVTANWDPERKNTFAEEIAHLHEELSEAFRAWRKYKDCEVREINGKLEGVPIEFADALIGMFYNAELHGFDLLAAVEQKHQFNLKRNYVVEGRQLHAPATREAIRKAGE